MFFLLYWKCNSKREFLLSTETGEMDMYHQQNKGHSASSN